MWGTGFIASKIGLQHAAPFTFLTLRFAFGIACLALIVLVARARWPQTRADFGHVLVAGLLMHAVHLGGSHYTQYLGLSAGMATGQSRMTIHVSSAAGVPGISRALVEITGPVAASAAPARESKMRAGTT